jgi:hypothetical protein
MLATIKCAPLLQAVSDDANSAMIAGWCERMNGAFEAIKSMRLAAHGDLKRFVVVVAAGFTCSHDGPPFADMSQMYIEVCKWHPVPNNEDCQTSVRGTRDRRQFRNAVRAPLLIRSNVGLTREPFQRIGWLYLGSRLHFCDRFG